MAKGLNPSFASMITPSRWFSGGKGLDRFRDEMLKDHRMATQHASRDVFGFVPDLPMSRDWTEPALYRRYGLSAEDIGFIEATVKPMDAA